MQATKEMPVYRSIKNVWALKIKSIKHEGEDGSVITPEEEGYAPFRVSPHFIERHKPEAGGYYVVYKDGYASYSPAQAFEEGNVLVGNSMNIGQAIDAMKAGYKVTRKGWNGQGMFAYYVPAQSFPSLTEHAKEMFGETTPYRAYLALKTAQNDIACWNPSTSDILAEDWIIVF